MLSLSNSAPFLNVDIVTNHDLLAVMGTLNDAHIQKFAKGKTISSISSIPGAISIVFTDGEELTLTLRSRVETLPAEVVAVPHARSGAVIELGEIDEGRNARVKNHDYDLTKWIGKTVYLKGSTSRRPRTAVVLSGVSSTNGPVLGGVKLDKPLKGFRYWNVEDLERVKS